MTDVDGPVGDFVVRLEGVVRKFGRGATAVTALGGVDLTVGRGEYVALQGRSGSGKTTLLNVIGGLDQADEGVVEVVGSDFRAASNNQLIKVRRDRLAFVFQAFGLLPILSAAENIEVPLRLQKVPTAERRARVAELLEQVGLEGRAGHRPHEMSGGEQQRVAIARALANNPDLLIADEPTGQLDSTTGRRVMELLRQIVEERGLSMIVATHDPSMIADADRTVGLKDGRNTDELIVSMPTSLGSTREAPTAPIAKATAPASPAASVTPEAIAAPDPGSATRHTDDSPFAPPPKTER